MSVDFFVTFSMIFEDTYEHSNDAFALILSDIEFNFQHNNIVDKLKNEEHQVRSNKQEQRCHCVRKRDFSPAFTSKYFLQIFLLKYLKHVERYRIFWPMS